jgi:sodium-dependent phosphate cotransporter
MSEQKRKTTEGRVFLRILCLCFLLWLFLCSINGIGASFKFFKVFVSDILGVTQTNPVLGLLVGIVTTSIIQSSSTTTSLIVGMVAGGVLTVEQAVPMIMGANIGTTITNTLVSMGSLARREEFKRAFAAASIHDIFNLLAVLILLPLEHFFHLISSSAYKCTVFFLGKSIEKPHSPIKAHFKQVIKGVHAFFQENFGERESYLALLLLSILILILSLTFIVKVMKGVILAKAEVFFDRFIGRSAIVAMVFGGVLTALVQSSSITTSLMVPLAGAGVLSLRNLYPITLGCNMGTTITALLASIASGTPAALTIALCHVLFNFYGIFFLYVLSPMRQLVLFLSQRLADICSQRRWMAFVYVFIVFFVIPGAILTIQYWEEIKL